jgi:hypothetical protein
MAKIAIPPKCPAKQTPQRHGNETTTDGECNWVNVQYDAIQAGQGEMTIPSGKPT